MRKWFVWFVWLACILSCPCSVDAGSWKKKKDGMPEKKVEQSEYDKLFKGKRYETAISEFMAVHKMGGKVYLEYPLRLMGRELLLASATTASTDNTVCTNGYKENTPLYIRFTLENGAVQLRRVNAWVAVEGEKEKMEQIVRQNYSDPVVAAYKVLAYTPDSLAVVFEMTGMFLNEEPRLSPMPEESGGMKVTAGYIGNLSSVVEVKAFEDNVSVKSRLMYNYSVTYDRMALVKDKPLNVEVTRTLLLLPEEKMRPRISDLRLGVFLTQKRYLSDRGEEVGKVTYANRWRLEPRDEEAYWRGELVEPVKPIVFYLDTLFPEAWKEPIREGVLKWNSAFEKIGFKNVMQVRDFPRNDRAFDPDNLKYSCIRYVPTAVANAMGPSWVDPSTGEILNASVLIYNNVIEMIRCWRFVQTAQVDPSVRGKMLPEAILNESLSYVVAHEVGHCLGLMHNMAASAAFPVDSLRSAEFTKKYGTTPSIMDYARFNYVAQPEDEGVKLTPPDIGMYDEFVIRWLYSPVYGASSIWDEAVVLESWVDEKADNPMYRYGRQQLAGRYDPSAIEEDLGDNPVKAGEYGIRNLKYILVHLNEWMDDDPEAEYRQQLYGQIVNQYYRYVRNVTYNIGGIYLSDAKEGGRYKRYQPVDREVQRASVRWVFGQLRDAAWLDDPLVLRKFPLGMAPSVTLIEAVGRQLLASCGRIALAASLAGEAYTTEDYFDDLYEGVWASAMEGRELTRGDMILQSLFVKMSEEPMKTMGGGRLGLAGEDSPTLLDTWCYGLDPTGMTNRYMEVLRQHELSRFGNGYGWQRVVDTRALEEMPAYYLEMMVKVRCLLEEKMKGFSEKDRTHYEAMLFMVKQVLGRQAGMN